MDQERELEKFKVELQKQLEIHKAELDAHYDHWRMNSEFQSRTDVEMFRGLIAFALAALKSIIIINGAAAVAILALLASVWGKDAMVARDMAAAIKPAMLLFVVGVAAGSFATALAYLTQVVFLETKMLKLGATFRVLALLAGFASLAAFGFGAVLTVNALAV